MTQDELLQPLRNILNDARALLALAQAEDWDALDAGTTSYHQQAEFLNDEAYLQAIAQANLVDEAKALVADIQTINDLLDLMATQGRDKLASELRQMLQSSKAMDAYGR